MDDVMMGMMEKMMIMKIMKMLRVMMMMIIMMKIMIMMMMTMMIKENSDDVNNDDENNGIDVRHVNHFVAESGNHRNSNHITKTVWHFLATTTILNGFLNSSSQQDGVSFFSNPH